MRIPKAVARLIEMFDSLPGIGPKTAQRLAFYLFNLPEERLERFAEAIGRLKQETKVCSLCFNVDETDPCHICTDRQRDQKVICVVEQPLDVLAFEKSGRFKGLYHVLWGVISPLNNVGPEELHIRELLPRLEGVEEVILATNPTIEGEATATYIANLIKKKTGGRVKVTRIGRGLPTGADIEYADELTLSRALEGRKEY